MPTKLELAKEISALVDEAAANKVKLNHQGANIRELENRLKIEKANHAKTEQAADIYFDAAKRRREALHYQALAMATISETTEPLGDHVAPFTALKNIWEKVAP